MSNPDSSFAHKNVHWEFRSETWIEVVEPKVLNQVRSRVCRLPEVDGSLGSRPPPYHNETYEWVRTSRRVPYNLEGMRRVCLIGHWEGSLTHPFPHASPGLRGSGREKIPYPIFREVPLYVRPLNPEGVVSCIRPKDL